MGEKRWGVRVESMPCFCMPRGRRGGVTLREWEKDREGERWQEMERRCVCVCVCMCVYVCV